MSKILVVNGDPSLEEIIWEALTNDEHTLCCAPNGKRGLEMLSEETFDLVVTDLNLPEIGAVEFLKRLRKDYRDLKCMVMTEPGIPDVVIGALREHICGLVPKPFGVGELRVAVDAALRACPTADIEVISARPEWIELRVPCGIAAISPLQTLLIHLGADLSPEMRDAISDTFREMLSNAIEHGCKLDLTKRVEISYVRLKHAIICHIKDPGEGFDPARLEHAAINNPSDNPFHHIAVREQRGLRSGGYGMLLSKQLVDELVYNEPHNEVMFAKYLN